MYTEGSRSALELRLDPVQGSFRSRTEMDPGRPTTQSSRITAGTDLPPRADIGELIIVDLTVVIDAKSGAKNRAGVMK